MEIDNNLTCLSTVHNSTVEKVTKITRFWSRFWLSLPGRINIYKTMCLSQINYIGCLVGPTDEQLKTIVCVMENFVKGKLSISRDKLYSSVDSGGLGLIDVHVFIKAQQVLWVKRVIESASDNWREDVYNITYGNPLVLHPALVNPVSNPIIHGIAKSFDEFKKKFYCKNENFRGMYLFYNPLIEGNVNDKRPMDMAFFRQIPALDPVSIVKLRLKDVYTDRALDLNRINGNPNLNVGINFLTYLRLTGSCRNFMSKLKNNRTSDGTCQHLDSFFRSFKKGSARIRKTFEEGESKEKKISELQTFRTFVRITGIPRNENFDDVNNFIAFTLWGEVYLPNQFREFLYKFFNNCLGINTRLSHFVQNQGRGCTFCSIKTGVPIIPDETFLHLFYECQTVQVIHRSFAAKFFMDVNLDDELRRRFWFGILPSDMVEKNSMQYPFYWYSLVFGGRNLERSCHPIIKLKATYCLPWPPRTT
jgi:hypothetical protein